MSEYQSPTERDKPTFVLRPKFILELSLPMAEQVLDILDKCVETHVFIPKESWALYKQLENYVGGVEETESPRKRRL